MASITAMDIVRLFEEDAKARKRLAELLVSEPDVRLAIINAVLRDVATKQDIEKLRNELRNEFKNEIRRLEERINRVEERIAHLEKRVGSLEERVARLDERVSFLVRVVFGFNLPILLAIIGLLLKMLWE